MSRTPEEIARILVDMYEDEDGGDCQLYYLSKEELRHVADMSRLEDVTIQRIKDQCEEFGFYVADTLPPREGFAVFDFRPINIHPLSKTYLRRQLGFGGPPGSCE